MPAIKFQTQFQRRFEERRTFPTNVGSPVVLTYAPEYDKQGNLQLVQDGEKDLYAEIQSHKDSTDLALILNRYFNGDPMALSRVQGAYMDVTGMPTNLHEAMSLVDNARRDFDTLPVDIKQLFDNDANKFLATLGSPEWFEKMQVKKEEPAEGGAHVVEE